MTARFARMIAWSLVGIYFVLAGTGMFLMVLTKTTPANIPFPIILFIILMVVMSIWPIIGARIISHYPRHPIGWLLIVSFPMVAIDMFLIGYAFYATLMSPAPLPIPRPMLLWLNWSSQPFALVTFTLMNLLFPNGKLLSARWRIVAWISMASLPAYLGLQTLEPGPIATFPSLDNPYAVGEAIWEMLLPVYFAVIAILSLCNLASIVSLFLRLRRAQGEERQQVKWLVFPAILYWISQPLGFLVEYDPSGIFLVFSSVLVVISVPAIVTAVAFAIFKYRLYDIDLIINRTLVYGTLTACVVGLYVLIVGGAGLMIQTNINLAGLLITAILVGAIYRPMRAFLQSGVNRLIHGTTGAPSDGSISHPSEIAAGQVEVNEHLDQNISIGSSQGDTGSERRLSFIRAIWWLVALLAFGFIAVGVPDRYAQLSTVSPGATTLVGQLRPDQAHAFEQAGISVTFYAIYFTALDTLITLLFASTGLVIVWFRPEDRAALLISLFLIGIGLSAIAVGTTQPRWHLAIIAARVVWYASSMPALYLFPDGRFVPRWTRWLTAIWFIYTVAWLIFPAISPPFGFSQGFTGSELPRNLWILLWICSGLAAQIYRYRQVSNAMERQQMKWVEFGFWSFTILFVLGGGIITLTQLAPMGEAIMIAKLAGTSIALLGTLAVPLSLGASILRYRLFDIDIIINRTLVYGALTAIVVAIYVLIVGVVGTILHAQGNLLITLLATGLIAVLFQPLRERLQRAVNRLIYGERDDPIEALSRLGKQMEVALPSDQVLPALVKTIAQTLRLPFVGITQKGQPDISFGQKTENPVAFPFTFQGETIGVLLASPRNPGDNFTPGEMRLLQNLARQAGAAVRNAQLTADLQRSRQTLVTAREDERHRLRRDLHDGIGPTMAGLTLKLDAAKDLVSSGLESGKKEELEEAVQLLSELKIQTQETVRNIRDIVHTLRPPSLDVLGLIPALQAHVGQVAIPNRLKIQMRTSPHPLDFPRCSAAVEVAAYRIVLEAVTNVIHHAQAGNCEVSLVLGNGNLKMEIRDDGVGLPKARSHGIGLDSMRERAEELGGRFELSSSPQGTRVCAEIPVPPARNES